MLKYILILLLFSSCAKSQQTTVNGAGTRIKINGTGLIQKINGSFYFPPVSGDITFSDSHFQFSIPGIAKTGFTQRSTAGFVEFRTSETAISVKVGGNWSTATSSFDEQSDCEVLVDGVYNQSVRLTADYTTQTHAITLPAGEKVVRLVNGYTANDSVGNIIYPGNGVYVQGVVTTGDIEIKGRYPTLNKWLFIGNSITTGASGTHPSVTGFPGLFRNDGRDVMVDAWGARSLVTTSTVLADQMAAFVSTEMNGVKKNELFLMLGTNNFFFGGGHSKANFKLWYGYFIDALHTLRPDIIKYAVSPFNRTTYSTPNSQGATLEDYYDAIMELGSTRAWLKIMYGKNFLSLVNAPDGLHPNQTGFAQVHDSLLIRYNALQ